MALVAAALAVTALATLNYRHHSHRTGTTAVYRSADRTAPYTLAFVEIDDQGWLWQPAQAQTALELIERTAAQANTFVVVYVHGWHHDASCCDRNVACFKALLAKLSRQLRRAAENDGGRGSPAADRPSPDRVVGVYVGWRGRSMPGWLDFLTFWGRKAAAERVGQGDLREFLLRLDRLHDVQRANEAAHTSLGLVTIGHSFGAQAVFQALAPRLEADLISAGLGPGYLRAQSREAPDRLETPLEGVGDFVVLVNPAVTAAEYERMRRLARQLRYPLRQSPILLVIAAENDRVNRSWFPLDRIAARWSRLGATLKPDQRMLETSALGIYAPQQTHRLAPVAEVSARQLAPPEAVTEAAPGASRACDCTWISRKSPAREREPDDTLASGLRDDVDRLRVFDFSGQLTAGGVQLTPLGGGERIDNFPYLIVRADTRVIDGHNGIFTSAFADFLVPYMVFVEKKKHIWHDDVPTAVAAAKAGCQQPVGLDAGCETVP